MNLKPKIDKKWSFFEIKLEFFLIIFLKNRNFLFDNATYLYELFSK